MHAFLVDQAPTDREAQRTVISDWVSKRVEKTSFGDRVARSLSRADLKFKVGEYFVFILALVFSLGLVAYFIGNRSMISAGIGAIAGGVRRHLGFHQGFDLEAGAAAEE